MGSFVCDFTLKRYKILCKDVGKSSEMTFIVECMSLYVLQQIMFYKNPAGQITQDLTKASLQKYDSSHDKKTNAQ